MRILKDYDGIDVEPDVLYDIDFDALLERAKAMRKNRSVIFRENDSSDHRLALTLEKLHHDFMIIYIRNTFVRRVFWKAYQPLKRFGLLIRSLLRSLRRFSASFM